MRQLLGVPIADHYRDHNPGSAHAHRRLLVAIPEDASELEASTGTA